MTDTKQPEALRLADLLEGLPPTGRGGSGIHTDIHFVEPADLAAIELRRLHEVNQELLEALHEMIHQFDLFTDNEFEARAIKDAKAAIAKAEGESK